eukprot:4584171-Pyramimonas_sp.AAC.1
MRSRVTLLMRARDAIVTSIESKPQTAVDTVKPPVPDQLWLRAKDLGANAKSWLSDFTGYEAIEKLKTDESNHHSAFVHAKESLKELQGGYEVAGMRVGHSPECDDKGGVRTIRAPVRHA